MRLKITPLIDVDDVNDYQYTTEWHSVKGDAVDLYFMLSDQDKPLRNRGGGETGTLRYMPAVGATLNVTFKNIDCDKTVTRYAIQPFPQDPSIWKISVLSTDPMVGTVNMKFVLSEPGTGFTNNTKTSSLRACFLGDDNQVSRIEEFFVRDR